MKQSIIIGASAAGLSAAIYLKRQNIDFQIIGKDIGGEMALSGIIENYPGFPLTDGVSLTQKFKEHIDKYQISVINETVEDLVLDKQNEQQRYFKVITTKNVYTTKTLIVATGSTPKKLNVPGEDKFYHKGLSYCSVCDLPLFKNKTVAIIGGGNSANEAGIMGSRICKQVYVITKNPLMKGDKILIEELKSKTNVKIITNALTIEILGENFVSGVKYKELINGATNYLKTDGVFIHIGLQPNTKFIPPEWSLTNSYGEVIVNELCHTKIPGIFAAGDVTNIPHKQIGIAVGQGIIASLETIKFINSLGAQQ